MNEKEEYTKIEEVSEEAPKKVEAPKKSYFIINIMGGDFILKDESGLGHRISIPKKYKNASIGDKISL